MYEQVLKATADDRGHYQVRGPRNAQMDPPTVIAHAEGRPPALAYAPTPGADGRPSTLDITLADAAAGRLGARDRDQGWPADGRRERGAGPADGAYPVFGSLVLRARDRARPRRVEALIHPAAVTDPMAWPASPASCPAITSWPPPRRPTASARQGPIGPADTTSGPVFARAPGVGVAEGRETAFTMAIHPQPCTAQLQVLRPDGKPWRAGACPCRSCGAPRARHIAALDGQGMASYTFPSPGLWGIEVRFRDSEMKSFPITAEPYYQAEALLPIAPGLTPDGPIRLVGVRRGLGSLRVRLLDVDGRPARGTVETSDLVSVLNQPDFAARTDDQGVVVFRDVPSGLIRSAASSTG